MLKGALSLAECRPAYKVDCTLLLQNKREKRDFILRTSLDSIAVWKTKNNTPASPYQDTIDAATKDAAIIDNEVWVFGVDATNTQDVFTAVKIGMKYHKAKATDIIGDVYVKNLNAENQQHFSKHDLIIENKKLYSGVCGAVTGAAKLLGVQGLINFYVISSNINPKIPKEALHEALKSGGAETVETDENKLNIASGPNNGNDGIIIKQNLHLATLRV